VLVGGKMDSMERNVHEQCGRQRQVEGAHALLLERMPETVPQRLIAECRSCDLRASIMPCLRTATAQSSRTC
jgi:hypothetical protein